MTMEYTSPDKNYPPQSHKGRFWYHVSLLTLSILLAATVVALFPAFHYAQWSLPTKYSLKETQQFVNFVVVAVALLISWLLSHCLSITNDAEATAEFETKTFSLARLQTRSAAAGKDVVDLLRFASHNGRLWSVAGPFALSLTAFSAMAWVLSLLFVIEARLVPDEDILLINVTLGMDVPASPDACRESLTAANCTYDLATSALASQLVTHTPYTLDNVTFSGAIGTQALPVGALQNFASASANSRFSSERSQYCLPILKPDLITCTPDTDNSRAKYMYMGTRHDSFLNIGYDSYEVSVNPDTPYNQSYVLVSSNGQGGVMNVAHSGIPGERAITILTGSGQYASLLSQLSTGTEIKLQGFYNETIFTVICHQPSDNTTYSWQWVDFEMSGGVMTTTSTGEICRSNDKDEQSPVKWLDYALEGAVSSVQLRDGYSKLLNTDYLQQSGEDYARMKEFNMTPLEYIMGHIVAIVNTAWTATNTEIANSTQIEQRKFEHRYVVNVEIQGPTILALCVATIILICAVIQALRWGRAQIALHRQGRSGHARQWDLLDPLQLLAYGSLAAESVARLRLADEEKRTEIMKNMSGPTLGFGPGTLAPDNTATSDHELSRYCPSSRHSRSESAARLVHPEEDFPSWDDWQSQRSVPSPLPTPSLTSGMRPLMLRASSNRSHGPD